MSVPNRYLEFLRGWQIILPAEMVKSALRSLVVEYITNSVNQTLWSFDELFTQLAYQQEALYACIKKMKIL